MKNVKCKIEKSITVLIIFFAPIVAHGATYIVGGTSATVTVGQAVELKLGIDTEGEKVNVFDVQSILPEGLSFVRFSKDQSAVNLWVKEPEYNASNRVVSFVGGVPGGLAGTVVLLRMWVMPRASGTYTIGIDSSSAKAYLNDGLGTPAPLRSQNATLTVDGRDSRSKEVWLILGFGLLGIIIWSIWSTKRKNLQK